MDTSIIESFMHQYNDTPLDDFCGLTPSQMHHLIHEPFGTVSPLKFHSDLMAEIVDRIPFFCFTDEFLKIIKRDGGIKLTPKGALPQKVIRELYGHKYILEFGIEQEISKLTREEDSVSITSLHQTTLLMGAIRKIKGELFLTKKGEELIKPEQRSNLFSETVTTFIEKFNWGYNDRYPDFPVGQFGWGYTIYLLQKFGDMERPLQFYADKYLKAFPKMLDHFTHEIYNPKERFFASCYRARVFERFLNWFGLVSMPFERDLFGGSDPVKRNDLLNEIFPWKISQ